MVIVQPKKPDTPVPVATLTPSSTSAGTPADPSELLGEQEVQNIVAGFPEVFTDSPHMEVHRLNWTLKLSHLRMALSLY